MKIFALIFCLLCSSFSRADQANKLGIVYNPHALVDVIEKVKAAKAQNKNPVVLFDLDDTTLNTRDRTLRILRDFVGKKSVAERYPEEAKIVNGLIADQIQFNMAESLQSVGVTSQDFAKEVTNFWQETFFTDKYCREDVPTPGARTYLHILAANGATLVYMTGRDIPRMGKGTADDIKFYFSYRAGNPRSVLLLKPDPKTDDLIFKKSSFEKVKAMGDVVGVFENEPANINAMADFFAGATSIFLDTVHSPNAPQVEPQVSWVKDFLLPERCADATDRSKDHPFCD